MNLIPTDIPGLDTLLGGGIPVGSLVILAGEPGTGKTMLALHLCFNMATRHLKEANTQTADQKTGSQTPAPARSGVRKGSGANGNLPVSTLYFSTLSEPHDKLLDHIRQFEYYNEEVFAQHLRLLSLTGVMEQNIEKVADLIVDTARQQKASLIVIDGFRALEALVHFDNDSIRRFLYRLSSQLSLLGVTTLITLERSLNGDASDGDLTVADIIIGIYNRIDGSREYSRMEISKSRGLNRKRGLHNYEISKSGISVFPRAETLVQQEIKYITTDAVEDRLKFGLPQLEEMMSGGPSRNSTTLVAGSPGTGKTLLGLYFLSEGVRRAEPGLLVGFYESRAQLLKKATRFGLDIQGGLDSGLIQMLLFNPIQLEADVLAHRMREVIEQHKIRRIVIDGILELERACQFENRSHDFMAALTSYFKEQNLTVIYNYTSSKLTGPELDLGNTPLSVLSENLILLRNIEENNQFYRTINILQMRDSIHDRLVHRFIIEDKTGIKMIRRSQSES